MQKTATQNARQPVASSLSRRSVKTVVRVTNPLRGSFPNLPSSSRSDSRIGHASRLVVRATATEDLCLDVPGLGGSDVDALNREFGQEGFIHFEKGEGGLTKVRMLLLVPGPPHRFSSLQTSYPPFPLLSSIHNPAPSTLKPSRRMI